MSAVEASPELDAAGADALREPEEKLEEPELPEASEVAPRILAALI